MKAEIKSHNGQECFSITNKETGEQKFLPIVSNFDYQLFDIEKEKGLVIRAMRNDGEPIALIMIPEELAMRIPEDIKKMKRRANEITWREG